MHVIDGASGGGQVLRSALAVAAVVGDGVAVENIRGDRSSPGLRPQHVAACRAVAAVTGGETTGIEAGADRVTLAPGPPVSGEYAVDIGTAGSVTLVCDAVLPLAAALDDPLSLTVTGGTDVRWAPPVDYYRQVKLPVLERMGLDAELTVDRRGFYPVGGGQVTLTVEPWTPTRLSMTDRGDASDVRIDAVASDDLAGADVADRMVSGAAEALAGLSTTDDPRYVEADSTGGAVVVTGRYGATRLGGSSLAEKGVAAETVGERAAERFGEAHTGPGAVDSHLADQLLVPLALAGGAVSIPWVTDHVRTSLSVLRTLGADVTVEERDRGTLLACEEPLLG